MSSSVTKKNSLCRYFIRYGDCFHGENCQYIHALPPQTSPQPQPVPVKQPPQPTPVPQIQNVQPPPPPPPQQQGYNMNKLICSFKSDLPNEIDFAMQVATLLANTDNFLWSKDFQLVDAICSSLHVFICICGDTCNCYCYPKFWHRILTRNSGNPNLQAATVPPHMERSYVNFNTLQVHDLKDYTKIYRRIKTAAELIKQFSMTTGVSHNEKNDLNNYNYHQPNHKKKKLKASPSLLKFVSLLLHCDDISLELIGLDILSNTASKISKVPEITDDPTCSKLVQMFQENIVERISRQDGDIYIINRSMEVVSKLISSSSKSVSSSITSLIIEKDLISRVEQFLTSHYDVSLFLSALECCYRISRHQPFLLTSGRTKYLLKILVNLLNCDDNRYFTSNALKRIKLVDEEDSSIQLLGPPIRVNPIRMNQVRMIPVRANNPTAKLDQPTNNKSSENNEAPPKEYNCEWNSCNIKFTEPKQLYNHVFETHIGPLDTETVSSCLWSGPNGTGPGCVIKRPKFSLLTHLNDFHCNQVARAQPVKPPEHPGYAPNAAMLAIKRHANAHNDLTNGNKSQSPLSVSVRLTAALILRNLATESPDMKQALENHESLLSEICMSNGRDESKIIAECLSLFSSE